MQSLKVIRRNNQPAPFDASKISVAITKAFIEVEGESSSPQRIHEAVEALTASVVEALYRKVNVTGTMLHVEDVQDQVEIALMRSDYTNVARAFVLYRDKRARLRDAQPVPRTLLHVVYPDGRQEPLNKQDLESYVEQMCVGLEGVDADGITSEVERALFDGIAASEIPKAVMLIVRTRIEQEPNYSYMAARVLLSVLDGETRSVLKTDDYTLNLRAYIEKGVELELLTPKLLEFDLDRLADALDPRLNRMFTYLGIQTLYDRYLLHTQDGIRFELPHMFFMRVAMGLAVNEIDREERAIEFYKVLSHFDFMSSTPTLFNSGTLRPQLSSCYLTTVPDDLDGIYSAIKDNALLSKYAGGLGNDWTAVRGIGSHIKGTNGKSQGVIPFLKVVNDSAVAVNQGGKRLGAVCAYLETWHIDIEEFLELRKNTGDDRRRTHDMNTANWIPDLFMERVAARANWTLFSPDETPDLHDLYGVAFKQRYHYYEEQAKIGLLKVWRSVPALTLWRKMLSMVFETGHPWITFKDPCNIRSPQQHVGVVHSSNLCTEITLNTSQSEIAVCNLGSINLVEHLAYPDKELRLGELWNLEKLARTVSTAMRMLDNVVDINFYTVPQARNSNLRHRPVGLGIMGLQDVLYKLQVPYASEKAIGISDNIMEIISFFAIKASTDLAEERGRYSTFDGSLWGKGVLPIDSVRLLKSQNPSVVQDESSSIHLLKEVAPYIPYSWDALRERVKTVGMRNSNVMAIAPTATISNICGVSQSIEPTYKNLFVKSNLSGEFTIINEYLIRDLKELGLWDAAMINDLKYYDGDVRAIDRVPPRIKELYATAFDHVYENCLKAASARQKWVDQSQSLNIYMREPNGRELDKLYFMAWTLGLKSTYYLRTLGATHVEKSTVTDGELNKVSMEPKMCSIDNPGCEACQ